MARKLKFRRKSGVHVHKHKNGRQRTYRKGDIIKIDDITELGNTIDLWEAIEEKKDPEIRTIRRREKGQVIDKPLSTTINETRLPEKAVDGIDTKDFVRVDDFVFNGILRNAWCNPETDKVYWMDESGYLSPMNEDDSSPKDKSGEVIGGIESDEPPLGLKAVHRSGGWYDVVNEKTGKPINDKSLRKDEAEALINEKIVESTGDMAEE